MNTIQETATLLNGTVTGNGAVTYQEISIDTRTLAHPERTLFIALRGNNHDGHQFIPEAYQLGVRGFITDREDPIGGCPEAGIIRVEHSLKALQHLASLHRSSFSFPVIALTGSNGKTVVKEWIFQALRKEFNIIRSPRSYNSQVGVPLSVLQMLPEHTLAVFEAGISQPGEMENLHAILRPTLGIFTHLGDAHQSNFSSLQQKAEEKARLFCQCDRVIFCRDQEIILRAIEKIGTPTFSWSVRKDPEADLHLQREEKGDASCKLSFQTKRGMFSATLPFTDEASVENACHVAALLILMGYEESEIGKRLELLYPVAMRLEQKQGIARCTLINDTYNSDLGSLTIALNLLSGQHQNPAKTVILSDILQTTRDTGALYQNVSRLMEERKIDRFIGIGEEINRYASIFSTPEKIFYKDTEQFLLQMPSFYNEAILIKGSRDFQFERIVSKLEEKAHETVLEINLDALSRNLSYFRSLLSPGTRMIAMVKAFSYGNGSFEIANLLTHHRVDYLAVAFADEGKTLRENGVRLPVLVMNPEPSSYEQMIESRLEPEIYHFRTLSRFAAKVRDMGIRQYPVHLKLDTGMHRLGFMEHELVSLVGALKENKDALKIASVFSHLAGAEDQTLDEFTMKQLESFTRMSDYIIHATGAKEVLRHILNSAGIERFPQYQFDMVRLGIGLYGISASGSQALQQVSALKSVVMQIKTIPAGESVGYGRKHIALHEQSIGIIPLGYADGLRRSLGNGRGKVLINGHFAPLVGNICMDLCMVDLTGLPVSEGDTALFFGPEYPVSEMARQLETIPYEILTNISPRVKRVYFRE